MMATNSFFNAHGEPIEKDRVARTTIEPYAHQVTIIAKGVTIAQTSNGLLLRETYAPDIYVPSTDVRLELLSPSENRIYCPYKSATAQHYNAKIKEGDDIAWRYVDPIGLPQLDGHFAFDFDKVEIEVDGQLVRGHVRDPHKIISVTPVEGKLQMEIAGQTVVMTDRALVLEETGLPSRYYVPHEDIDAGCLVKSDRVSVCTYKGEATYHNLQVGEQLIENAVWTYADPWTDFSSDVGKIRGYSGFYSSTFDRILLGDAVLNDTAKDAAADQDMIAKPTVDQVLLAKVSS